MKVGGENRTVDWNEFGPSPNSAASLIRTEIELGAGGLRQIELAGVPGEYAGEGTFTSGVIDLGEGAQLDSVEWTSNEPIPTSVDTVPPAPKTASVRTLDTAPTIAKGGGVWENKDIPDVTDPEWGGYSMVSSEIAATIEIPPPMGHPEWIACDEVLGKTFVTRSEGAVTVIDTASNLIIGTIEVGGLPWGIDCDETIGKTFVANRNTYNVSVIDSASNSVIATITTGSYYLHGVACDETAGKTFITDIFAIGYVFVINSASNAVITSIKIGSQAEGVVCDESVGKAFVTNLGSHTVSVIHTASHTVSATISVGTQPTGIACDEDLGKVFVANYIDGTVSVIDTASNTVSATISVGISPYSVVCKETRLKETLVTNEGNDCITVIDSSTNLIVLTISIGDGPRGIAYDETAGKAFAVNKLDDTVSVIPEEIFLDHLYSEYQSEDKVLGENRKRYAQFRATLWGNI